MTDAHLARLTVAAIFIYHGLVPKLLMRDATELQLFDAHGLPHGLLALAGAGELLLGLLIALLHRQRWPLYVAQATLLVLLVDVAIFVPLAAMIVACLVGRLTRVFAGIFAVVFVVTLCAWPVATAAGPTPAPTEDPWIFYLVNVATVASVVAFPLVLQIVWTVATPILDSVNQRAPQGSRCASRP